MSTLPLCLPEDFWMPFNLGAYMRKRILLGPEETDKYIADQVEGYLAKRARAHDKARWAAAVRWARARGQTPSKLEQLSNAQSILEKLQTKRSTIFKWLANAQKRSEKAAKAARARWDKVRNAKSMGFASPRARVDDLLTGSSKMELLRDLNPSSPFPHCHPPEAAPSDPKFDRRAAGQYAKDGNPHGGVIESVARPLRSFFGGLGIGANPQNQDPRCDEFRAEVKKFWTANNRQQPECPWIRKDEKALAELLEGSPRLTIETLRQWLRNRADSEINPSDLPRRWLADLAEFADGPLDRFRKPLYLSEDYKMQQLARVGVWKGPE